MMDCCCPDEGPTILSQASDISDIIIAIASLALAIYVFVYQKRRDRQTAKLEWFKDLIIEPNRNAIYKFFDDVTQTARQLRSLSLSDARRVKIIEEIKDQCATYRKDFINLLYIVDAKMVRDMIISIDYIQDSITNLAFDSSINLSDDNTFDAKILSVIRKGRNYCFDRIFKYNGS
jgi:hypothetical protein